MKNTFGQNLKFYRKSKAFTQQELAELLGVSVQAVSKWETDVGMPDISQLAPLSRVLGVSCDCLLGIAKEHEENEFRLIYEKCMEIESSIPQNWPPAPEKAKVCFQMMYDFFSTHPNNAHAAKYLLDLSDLYWGKICFLESESLALKECERFAGCIFKYSGDADLIAEAHYLLASVLTRTGQREKADEELLKIPFRYGDRHYLSGEIAATAHNYEQAEAHFIESFSSKTRFVFKSLRYMASFPNKSTDEQIAYLKYALCMINAFLSGSSYMPHRLVYQKLTVLFELIKRYSNSNDDQAILYFKDLVGTAESYLHFLNNGSPGKPLFFLEDAKDLYAAPSASHQKKMVSEYLSCAISYCMPLKVVDHPDFIEYLNKAEQLKSSFLNL